MSRTRPVPHPDFWQQRETAVQPYRHQQRTRRAPLPVERRTHIALADLLRVACAPGWWWSHIPSGEHRSASTGALLKRMGLRRGMLDFLLIAPDGRHHWLELKRGPAPLTDAQENFTEHLTRCGVLWCVARDYGAAVRQLTAWGVVPGVHPQ